jgi:hypothetical protein
MSISELLEIASWKHRVLVDLGVLMSPAHPTHGIADFCGFDDWNVAAVVSSPYIITQVVA